MLRSIRASWNFGRTTPLSSRSKYREPFPSDRGNLFWWTFRGVSLNYRPYTVWGVSLFHSSFNVSRETWRNQIISLKQNQLLVQSIGCCGWYQRIAFSVSPFSPSILCLLKSSRQNQRFPICRVRSPCWGSTCPPYRLTQLRSCIRSVRRVSFVILFALFDVPLCVPLLWFQRSFHP